MSGSMDPSRSLGLPEGFSAEDFIEQLSQVDLEFAKKNATLEPRPFIRTFERALERLQASQHELSTTISQLERSTKAYADDHRKKTARLKQMFGTVGTSFERLEAQISEVSSNTIRIGEQLDTVAKEKDRAEAIKELVGFYAELNEGNASRLDELLEGGSEGMLKVAHTLRRLNTIVIDNEYTMPTDSTAKRQIEIYSENFEKTMLENFEAAYRDNDIHSMGVAARTLDAFNGGTSVVKAYINQHPYFLSSMISQSQDSIAEASYQSMKGISDINCQPPAPDRWLVQLYKDTRDMMFKDWGVISKVFPRPVDVMQLLLKRVFEQTIQSYLETLLERAEHQSKLAFLRVLSSSHLETRKLIEDLQSFDAETITPAVTVLETARRAGNAPQGLLDIPSDTQTATAQFSRSRYRRPSNKSGQAPDPAAAATMEDDDDIDEEAEVRDRLGAAKSGLSSAMAIAMLIGRGEGDSAGVGLLHGFLNRCCDDLFESYIAGGNYMKAEHAHMREAFRQTLGAFVRARSERQASSRGNGFLGIFSSVGGSSVATPAATAATAATNSGAGGGNAGVGGSGGRAAGEQPAEFQGTVTIATARTLLQVHSEAVARTVELESDGLTPEAVASLFSLLASMLGEDYMFPALEDVMESLQDLRQEPDLRTFSVIHTSNVVVRLIQIHFQRVIMPFVGTSSYIYRDMVAEKNQLMSRVEISLNLITNKLVGACIQWIGSILNKQRRGDFRPVDDDFSALEMGTQPCRQCTDYLFRIERVCRENMDKENQERVLSDIGNALHRLLMEHFTKFVVSVSGGLVVAKDVSKYREAIEAFGIPALIERFAALQDISNIFLVQPSALRSLLDEGPLSRLDRSTIQSFVQMREDFKTLAIG
ncbi:Exocyst complex component 5 [Dipsacomyces acuminosporus]|nr:Exocyst complex component 5 [Dipsacomyces acuminosporus]